MILTFIAIGLIILGVILLVIDINYYENFIYIPGVLGLLVGLFAMLIIGSIAIVNHCAVDEQIYESEMNRESILKQIEVVNSNYEDVSKTEVILRVYDWNQDVHNTKYWANNKWTNWLYSQKYVDSLEYIELEE